MVQLQEFINIISLGLYIVYADVLCCFICLVGLFVCLFCFCLLMCMCVRPHSCVCTCVRPLPCVCVCVYKRVHI